MKLSKLQIAGVIALQRDVLTAQQALNDALTEIGIDTTKKFVIHNDGEVEVIEDTPDVEVEDED